MNTQPVATANTPSVEDYLAQMEKFGEDTAKGGSTQIMSALLMIEGAYHGKFDLQPNKHGTGIDDAEMLAKRFSVGFSKHSTFNAKSKSHGKLKSNGRKCIRVGTSPQWGVGQPLANVNDFVDGWRALRKANTKGLEDCYNALMKYLTVQLKDPQLITGNALSKFYYKNLREEPTALELIQKYAKELHKLTIGKAPGCKEIDSSPEVKAAIAALNKRATAIAQGAASVAA